MPRLIIRGYGARPNKPAPVITGTTFFDALRSYLLSAESLTSPSGMTGLTDVYYRTAKPGFAYPFLIVSPVGDSPELNSSALYLESCDVQFSVVATGPTCDEDAEALGGAAYRWLAPKMKDDAGNIIMRPRLTSTYANETAAIPGRKYRAAQPGRGPNNQNVFAFHFRYTFLVTRSMVV